MTYTFGKLRREDFFEPDFDASIYFDLGARIFSTQWPPYVAHILQGLLTRTEPAGGEGAMELFTI